MRFLLRPAARSCIIAAILAAFVFAGVSRYAEEDGDDLAASFIGCRLIATGQQSHLYAHDPDNFAAIGPDAPWQSVADDAHYDGFTHPYVQTPLWAFALQPLCTRTGFPGFERIFAWLTMLAFAGAIWLIARFWTPSLYNPPAIALIVLALWFSQPFRYAMDLMQTHVLFFFLTVAALILAERRRPGLAGLLLALAAAVKITPAVFALYWLLIRRWKAALSMALASAALWIATLLTTGPALAHAYLADLHRVSRILLLAENNQSVAAAVMSRFYPAAETLRFQILPLPTSMRLGCIFLTLACTIAGALIDRRREPTGAPPIGAMLSLVAATVFAPIAWTHYSIILVAPLMVLAQQTIAHRSEPRAWRIASAALFIAALNFKPLAVDIETRTIGPHALLRSECYAAILTLLVLAAASRTTGVLAHIEEFEPTEAWVGEPELVTRKTA